MDKVERIILNNFSRRGINITECSDKKIQEEIYIVKQHLRLKHSHHLSRYTSEDINELKYLLKR